MNKPQYHCSSIRAIATFLASIGGISGSDGCGRRGRYGSNYGGRGVNDRVGVRGMVILA